MTIDRTNDAPWQPLPADPWVVYKYRMVNGKIECHAELAYDKSADADAGKPFDQAAAEARAEYINNQTGVDNPFVAMALPVEQTEQPGV